jgi:hypothetical protein
MDDTVNGLTTTKDFVKPSPELLVKRYAARYASGHQVAAIDSQTGAHATHLVRVACSRDGCPAETLATEEHAKTALCGPCLHDQSSPYPSRRGNDHP